MTKKRSASFLLKQKLEYELTDDEVVLWTDEPAPIFAKNLLLFFIFMIFFILWISIDTFNIWSILLFTFMISAVLWIGSKVHFKKTLYVITNKRALIIQKTKTYTIRSYPPNLLKFIYLTEKKMGIGDLIFEENISQTSSNSRKVQQFGFFNVKKVKLVEQMLRSLAEQNSQNNKV